MMEWYPPIDPCVWFGTMDEHCDPWSQCSLTFKTNHTFSPYDCSIDRDHREQHGLSKEGLMMVLGPREHHHKKFRCQLGSVGGQHGLFIPDSLTLCFVPKLRWEGRCFYWASEAFGSHIEGMDTRPTTFLPQIFDSHGLQTRGSTWVSQNSNHHFPYMAIG